MFLLVGLGNPGEKYARTRHNVGRIVLDAFMARNGFSEMKKSKHTSALHAQGELNGVPAEVMYPETYMNRSGLSVKAAVEQHDLRPEHTIVVSDDIDLPVGSMRIAFGRGAGGHKGVQSIISHIKTKDFVRIRIVIAPVTFLGNMKKPAAVERFVLMPFSRTELRKIQAVSARAGEAIETIISEGHVAAMNRYN